MQVFSLKQVQPVLKFSSVTVPVQERALKQVQWPYLKSWRSSPVDQARRLSKQTDPYPSKSEAEYCDEGLQAHKDEHLQLAYQFNHNNKLEH